MEPATVPLPASVSAGQKGVLEYTNCPREHTKVETERIRGPGGNRVVEPDKHSAGLSRLAGSAFDEYHRSLHKFLLRRLANAADASDALQEVFLRLLRLRQAELVRSPQAYLYGIASHVVREYQMRARRERVTFSSQVANVNAEQPPEFMTDDLAENLGLEREVETALEKLSVAELRILLYNRRDGLSIEEIAQKMGLSVHTVKKYLFRAIALVRTSLAQVDSKD